MNRHVTLSSQWPVEIEKMNSCFFSLLKSTPLSTAFFSGAVGRQVHLKWDLLWQNNCWVIVEMSFGEGFEFTPPTHIMALLGMSNTSTYIVVWKSQARMYTQLERDTQTYAKIIALRFHSHVWYFIAWPRSVQISSFHLVAPVVNSLSTGSLPQYLRKCTKIWGFQEVSVPILYLKSTTFLTGRCTYPQIIQSMPNRISMNSSFIPPHVLVIVSV